MVSRILLRRFKRRVANLGPATVTDGQSSAGLSYLRVPLGASDFSDTRTDVHHQLRLPPRCLSLSTHRLYVRVAHE